MTSIIVTGGDLNSESAVFELNTADIPLQVKGTLTCDYSCDDIRVQEFISRALLEMTPKIGQTAGVWGDI